MIKPIPERLLIHTIQYEEFTRDGAFGEEFKPIVTIPFVLVQPKTQIRRNDAGEEIEIKAIVFIDALNTPNAQPLKEKSKVYFNNREWRVKSCESLYALNPTAPHHYEVMLT